MQNGLASRSSLASVIKTAAVQFSLFQFSKMIMVMMTMTMMNLHDHDRDDYDDIGHLLARRLWRSILQKHCTSQFGTVSLYQCGSMVYQCDTPNLTRLLLARPSTRQAWHLIITLEKTFLSRCGLL